MPPHRREHSPEGEGAAVEWPCPSAPPPLSPRGDIHYGRWQRSTARSRRRRPAAAVDSRAVSATTGGGERWRHLSALASSPSSWGHGRARWWRAALSPPLDPGGEAVAARCPGGPLHRIQWVGSSRRPGIHVTAVAWRRFLSPTGALPHPPPALPFLLVGVPPPPPSSQDPVGRRLPTARQVSGSMAARLISGVAATRRRGSSPAQRRVDGSPVAAAAQDLAPELGTSTAARRRGGGSARSSGASGSTFPLLSSSSCQQLLYQAWNGGTRAWRRLRRAGGGCGGEAGGGRPWTGGCVN
uniref:Uncharacterized protein n=1 Tax=Oryza rufipogon TaxID=4529 RepID=A0A0E0Q1X3_ORYRU